MTSIKFQMRLTVADLATTASVASALNARSGSPFANRASAIRYSFNLVARLIKAGQLDQVESLLTAPNGSSTAT